MSLLIPTSCGQAQGNFSGCSLTDIPINNILDLFDSFILGDSVSGNSGTNLIDLIRINEWLNAYIIKGVNPWTPGSPISGSWTPPTFWTQ